jgi:hypothetical protein
MTQMEIISDHVVNQTHAELEGWNQLMDYYHELACFIDLGDHVTEAIMWRVSYEFTKFQVVDAHLGHDALYLK